MQLRGLRTWRRPNPVALLCELEVTQDARELHLTATVSPGVTPLAVWGRVDTSNLWMPAADVHRMGDRFTAVVDVLSLRSTDPVLGSSVVLHLEVDRVVETGSRLAEQLAVDPDVTYSTAPDGQTIARYRPRLGRADATRLGRFEEVAGAGTRATPYPTAGGAVAVALDRDLAPFGSVYVSRLLMRGGVLRMRGRLLTRHSDLSSAQLLLKGRTSGHRALFPVHVEYDAERTTRGFGLRWYRYTADVDCAALLEDEAFDDDVYDAWMTLATVQSEVPFNVRIGRTRFLARYFTNAGWAEHGARAVAVTPYYTFKAKRTSLQMNVFPADTFRYLRREMRTRHLTRLRNRGRDIWLVGERPYKAQDTGYHFFRHLRLNHPDVEAYYVVERESPERTNVEPLGNVLDFGSKEHIHAALLARQVVGSHHPDFLYPLRTKQFRRAVRATKVFLQHGVMGTKWMANLYGKKTAGFETDLFIVSSEREKEYIVSDFEFDAAEVAVTGLSRFDSLFAGDVELRPHQLLVMPTWRDWLQDADIYLDSEYHLEWSHFLHDPRLRALQEQYGLEVVFCLHPNMQQFRHLFDDVPARVISQGEVDIQFLLKQSAVLVTDYSSVGFDFSFLHKPVLYFQFDREHFLGTSGSHLDLDEELPGPIVRSDTALLAELEESAACAFAMDPEYIRRADRFIAHRDRESSERIYQRARATRPRREVLERVKSHEVVAAALRYLRRHRLYFPAMRLMFRVLKRLPADDNLIFFESGLGKQYADSPRYIYEQLVRRGDTRTKVWSYSGRLPHSDPNTKVIKRLSPAYYYYLARSRYWVNNQSLPHYIKRRPDGVYVQTWHGTPLKRMLWDLGEVFGRDAGYVTRATDAAAEWSVLVSPSPFATKAVSSAFRYKGEVIEEGYPRNDLFYAEDREVHEKRIRRRIGIRPGQRVILYAPTFRDDQVTKAGRFTFALPFDLDRMSTALGKNTVILLRMHVLVRGRIQIPVHLRDVVYDVSSYPEMQELYLASDVLITDYSSVFFDFAALRRPMIFYAYDLEAYRDVLRGFYLDYEADVPGPVVTTEDGLLDALTHLDDIETAFASRREQFLARFAPKDDGHAAERVVDRVFGPPPG